MAAEYLQHKMCIMKNFTLIILNNFLIANQKGNHEVSGNISAYLKLQTNALVIVLSYGS